MLRTRRPGEKGVHHAALGDDYAAGETVVGVKGVREPDPGHLAHVRRERVRESPRGGDGHGGRDVLDAVVDDLVLDEGRGPERGRTGGLDAAAVIHVDVHYHATLLHRLDSSAIHQGWCPGSYHEDRPYEEVGTKGGFLYPEAARGEGGDASQAEIGRAHV